MADFFHMGGYAIYVWSSYGIALLILVGLLTASLTGLRRKERMLAALEQALPRRRRRDAVGAGGGDEVLLTATPTGKTGKHGHDDGADGGDGDGAGGDGGGGE